MPATLSILSLAAALAWAQGATPLTPADPLPPLVENYCIECHSGSRPKARLHLGSLAAQDETQRGTTDLRRIVDALDSFEMPPEGKPQPTADERSTVIAHLRTTLEGRGPVEADDEPSRRSSGRVTMRRLNRVEYENTIRDLLGVDFDASAFFPADDVGHGFDNIGDVLSMPPLLFEKYLDAAERIAAAAFPDPQPDGPPRRRVPGSALEGDGRGMNVRGEVRLLSSNATVATTHEFPISSRYRFTIEAAGQQAGPEVVKVALLIDWRALETFSVPATYDAPGAYTFETHIDAGSRRVGASFVNDYYQPENPDPRQRDRNCAIVAMVIEGPLDAGSPRAPRDFEPSIATLRETNPDRWLREQIQALASRAFRRPATQTDVRDLLEIAGVDGTPESRMRAALTAMLVSPRFLFRAEAASDEPRDLDGYEIASRLSYFLWSSMPDEALLDAAARGELDTREGVADHAARLLADPRSIALAENFATQWLHVRDLDRRTPDPKRYPEVDAALLEAMRAETILVFDAILREDRIVRDLLSCDFTFLNEALARHYGIPGVRGGYMRRVGLPRGYEGGVLAHASVLTATSNPNRTSPVKRGKWVMEAILDDPPPPPPPGVDSFDRAKEQAGGGTVREILARHRVDPECSVCHRTMDALGFALEEFDPVGRRRVTDNGLPIDARGELPDGRTLDGASALREYLLTGPAFTRSLAKHLFIYALGRGANANDEAVIDDMVTSMNDRPTIANLVRAIVQTDAFRRAGANQ